ncbi:MAG: CCA tRNA nucleotidyltransferase [Parachlamydiaceae bacterium]|nr:CCA tRNA nucleotidyltransferase [Parachlamydiaceae bacterium]
MPRRPGTIDLKINLVDRTEICPYTYLMDTKTYAIEIIQKLQTEGYIAYFAGGWVRDYLLGHPSDDIDIATNAPTQVILDLFPHTILVGIAFGVVIVVKDGFQFEVTTFRRDINYVDGRKPQQIEMSTAEEDAKRRDFTINGMFYNPIKHEIFDFVGGAEDLKKGIVRAIGDPYERFVEDRLRMIRAIRFSCHFGFLLDHDTREAIVENADTLFPAVAMERVWREFNRMAQGPRFDHALIELHSTGLLQQIFPLLQGVHLHEIKQRAAILMHFPANCPTILRLMSLFPSCSLDDKLEICRLLRISKREIDDVRCADQCKRLIECEETAKPIEWVYFYAQPAAQIVLEVHAARLPENEKLWELERHSLRREAFHEHIERLVNKKPLVNAVMLKELGFVQGALLGYWLKVAEERTITLDLNNPQKVIEALKMIPKWPIK